MADLVRDINTIPYVPGLVYNNIRRNGVQLEFEFVYCELKSVKCETQTKSSIILKPIHPFEILDPGKDSNVLGPDIGSCF